MDIFYMYIYKCLMCSLNSAERTHSKNRQNAAEHNVNSYKAVNLHYLFWHIIYHMALSHLPLCRFPIDKKRLRHQKRYQHISKYIQVYTGYVQDICKIPGGGQAARPGRASAT